MVCAIAVALSYLPPKSSTPPTGSHSVSTASPQANVANPVSMSTVASFELGTTAEKFFPRAPESLAQAGLSETDVEALILKALFVAGAATGRSLADQLRLPGPIVRAALDRLRAELMVTHKGAADLVDFLFQLTESGSQRAKQYALNNTYCGAAPVPLNHYVTSVQSQTIRNRALNLERFRRAMAGIYLNRDSVNELAQAVTAGRGMFLFGNAGNGKTTVAERLARSFDDYLWIPRFGLGRRGNHSAV